MIYPNVAAAHLSVASLAALLLAGAAAIFGVPPAAAAEPRTGPVLTLNSGTLILELEAAPMGGILIRSLRDARTGHEWATSGSPAGANVAFATLTTTGIAPGMGFRHIRQSIRRVAHGGTQLRLDLKHDASGLLLSLFVTGYPASPVVDLYLRLENKGRATVRDVRRFDPLSLPLAASGKPYRAHWVTRSTYLLHATEVNAPLCIDGGDWNGPDAAGWLAVEDADRSAFLVAGIEWERHWSFDLTPGAAAEPGRLSAGLRRACTQDMPPGAVVESPHTFLGIANGDLDDAANVTHDYLQTYVLPPKLRGAPYVCYDIWSTRQENVEPLIVREAEFAATRLGVEVFYHDASWYRNSDVSGRERWGVGLGSYAEDRRKLPNGMRRLSEVVHGLGMKFGLWVCPEMVDVTTMAPEAIPDAWMTRVSGRYNVQRIPGWNPMKMLCLGCPAAEGHIRTKLLETIDAFDLDWLKWDASGLPGLDIACDRDDHGHQHGNGSRQAVEAKYRILDAIHRKRPKLTIEQCSYGTRLDYGMARHGGRVNWLSDSTAPSSHVRRSIMAAAYVFPAAYNMTWVMRDDEVGSPQSGPFLDTLFRSRMMGAFGFGTLHGSLDERVSEYPRPVIEAALRNVRDYKTYRHLLWEHCYHLTPPNETGKWQSMQFVSRDRAESVVFYFRNGSETTAEHLRLRGLDPIQRYEVTRLNTGACEILGGAALLRDGIEIALTHDPEESDIVLLKLLSP